jgi:3-hydroxybutyryl-CoA dehydrogenase
MMKVEDIKKVLILGGGHMGQQIGFVCAMSGYDVTIYDISQEVLDGSMKNIAKLAKAFADQKRITDEAAAKLLARIKTTTSDVEAAKDADIISESVPENPELKSKIFGRFNELCPERTIFTTNTSSLMPSMFAAGTGRPEKLCALHFHDVRTTNIVDVMPHPGTAKEVTALVAEFARKIGQVPIVMHKENIGFVFNAMLMTWFESALVLAANDVASVEDIDRSWMGVLRSPMGPFGVMDQVGLKTVYTITDYWAKITKKPQSMKNAAFLKKYVDAGELGAKTKKGFYTYPNPVFFQPGFIEGLDTKK